MPDFQLGAFETLDGCEPSVGSIIVPYTVKKQFNGIILDQLDTDPVSCTLYSTFSILCDKTGKVITPELRKATFDKMVSDGKLRPGFGALIDDGVRYALGAFNSWAGTSFVSHKILLSPNSILSALDHSGIASGIKFGAGFFSDEQDDGRVSKKPSDISGNSGHSIGIIKMNTKDLPGKSQFKHRENYANHLPYNVIYWPDFEEYKDVWFKTGFYFTY